MNNFKFWEKYNQMTASQILKLLEEAEKDGRNSLLCDLHIHSNHSSDGKQTLDEIIETANKLGFKIIAITDHDDVGVYDELYKKIKKGKDLKELPIIITGVEQTVSYKEYGTMCHILKLFINPKDHGLNKDLRLLSKSYYKRAKIQFERISKNKALQDVFKENQITVSYKEFLKFLKKKNLVPDYAPLIEYIAEKLEQKKVKTAYVYEKIKLYNSLDSCQQRKEMCNERFSYLDNKYKTNNINIENNRRFLLSILAVRGVDDDEFKDFPQTGSLSVNEYGQVKISKLNENGLTLFAHPGFDKLSLVKMAKDFGGGIVGIEKNFKSQHEHFDELENFAKQENFIFTIGSDAHSKDDGVYEDLQFYLTQTKQIKKLVDEFRRKNFD